MISQLTYASTLKSILFIIHEIYSTFNYFRQKQNEALTTVSHDIAKLEITEVLDEAATMDEIKKETQALINFEKERHSLVITMKPTTENDKTEEKAVSQIKHEQIEIEDKIENINNSSEDLNDQIDMSASLTKVRITTEEEAKAALAERRRIAREEAERQAEQERRRIEEEQRLELERQQWEEEQQRILIENLRAAEEERLDEAIRDAQRREEEEKLRREEENRMKLLKEEAERKAREETERQKAELQERLKTEEKEREARRKRVEAIMLRTRGKNNISTPPQVIIITIFVNVALLNVDVYRRKKRMKKINLKN